MNLGMKRWLAERGLHRHACLLPLGLWCLPLGVRITLIVMRVRVNPWFTVVSAAIGGALILLVKIAWFLHQVTSMHTLTTLVPGFKTLWL